MTCNLYHIQDSDRPMYVVAKDWVDALNKCKSLIVKENDIPPDDEPDEPDGIMLVAGDDDLICDTIDAS